MLLLFVAVAAAIRSLSLSDVNFLHTTDTHGWYLGHQNQPVYSGDWGDFVSFAAHLKQTAHERGQDLLLVDSGDRHDGNGLSDITVPNGVVLMPIFMRQHYDIVTLGNHELYLLDAALQEAHQVAPHYANHYVCSNVEYWENGTWNVFGQRYRYFTTPQQKLRVLALLFLFDFTRNAKGTKVTPIERAVKERWFEDLLVEYGPDNVDLIVVVGHVPVDRKWNELGLLHAKLRLRFPETKVQYFGGHSHIRDFVVYDDHLTALQSGRFCETVGFLSINMTSPNPGRSRYFRSYIDFNRELFEFHSNKDKFDTDEGMQVKRQIAVAREQLGLDNVTGHVTDANYYMDYVPLSHPKNLYKLLTDRVLPLLPRATALEQRLIIINTGSVRYDLYKGPYTVDTHYIVSPFQNDWVSIQVPKDVALQIAPKLNEAPYIAYMRPPHQRNEAQLLAAANAKRHAGDAQVVMGAAPKLTKGYVTYDDFGHDGDDTEHKAVVQFPIPNVVQSQELCGLDPKELVEVVFYSFIEPNVRWALAELGHKAPAANFYSRRYLGLLLNDYVATHQV